VGLGREELQNSPWSSVFPLTVTEIPVNGNKSTPLTLTIIVTEIHAKTIT